MWYNFYRNVGDIMIDRKGIIIYFLNPKVIKVVNKLKVNVTYVNKAGKYLTGYCDAKDFPNIKKEPSKTSKLGPATIAMNPKIYDMQGRQIFPAQH